MNPKSPKDRMAEMVAAPDQGQFLQSEKDLRPHWETERRGMFWPIARNGYNNARDWAMPEALGGHGASVMKDIVDGKPLTPDEINHGAQGAANFMLTGGLAGNIGKKVSAHQPTFQYRAPENPQTVGDQLAIVMRQRQAAIDEWRASKEVLPHDDPIMESWAALKNVGPISRRMADYQHASTALKSVDPSAPLTKVDGYRGSLFPPEKSDMEFYWGSSSPRVANQYADVQARTMYGGGGDVSANVAPVQYRFANPLEVNAQGRNYDDLPKPYKYSDDVVLDAMKKGHDGVVIRNVMDPPDRSFPGDVPADTIAAIKRGTVFDRHGNLVFSNPKQGATAPLAENAAKNLSRDVDGLGYYSAALEAAKSWPQSKGTPEQAMAWLTKNGTKQAEIDATGVGNAFSGPVTRDDLVKYLGENRVGVRETKYGSYDHPVQLRMMRDEVASLRDEWVTDNSNGTYTSTANGFPERFTTERSLNEHLTRIARDSFIDDGRAASSLRSNAAAAYQAETGIRGEAKWSRQSLDPSNPTYRETVLSLPDKAGGQDKWDSIASDAHGWITARGANESEATSFLEALGAASDGGRLDLPARINTPEIHAQVNRYAQQLRDVPAFMSGHFPEPNIVGHMMSSLNKHEGKPVYTLDQIQSDWGQKLRDGGVRDEAKIAELKQASSVADQAFKEAEAVNNEVRKRNSIQTTPNSARELREARAAVDAASSAARLAQAEYNTATAAASGHPLVNTTDQWTNTTLRRGLQQAIDAEAEYMAIPSGKTVLGYNPGNEHGMETFYNQIVPKNLGNILAKLDKAGAGKQFVQQLETPSGMKGDGFSVFQITPAMREQARKGLPLFMNPQTAAIAPLAGNAGQQQSIEDILARLGTY